MLKKDIPLSADKDLLFKVVECDVPRPYELKWKVLNRGAEARRRNCIRGQIVSGEDNRTKIEYTLFQGDHMVECYAIKDGVVIARDSIDVPIQ